SHDRLVAATRNADLETGADKNGIAGLKHVTIKAHGENPAVAQHPRPPAVAGHQGLPLAARRSSSYDALGLKDVYRILCVVAGLQRGSFETKGHTVSVRWLFAM